MNAVGIIIELVELVVLITLLVYLARLIRDGNAVSKTMSKSDTNDKNQSELADFHQLIIADPDITRVWIQGRADHGLLDVDQERFSQLATGYLTILANQHQRADLMDDAVAADATTKKLVRDLQQNPGLLSMWEGIADDTVPAGFKRTIKGAMEANLNEVVVEAEPTATEDEISVTTTEAPDTAEESISTASNSTADTTESSSAEIETPEETIIDEPEVILKKPGAEENSVVIEEVPATMTNGSASAIADEEGNFDAMQQLDAQNDDEVMRRH